MTRIRPRWYVGICASTRACRPFQAVGTPTDARFPEYVVVLGPFRTARGARYAATHPRSAVHVTHYETLAALADGETR